MSELTTWYDANNASPVVNLQSSEGGKVLHSVDVLVWDGNIYAIAHFDYRQMAWLSRDCVDARMAHRIIGVQMWCNLPIGAPPK